MKSPLSLFWNVEPLLREVRCGSWCYASLYNKRIRGKGRVPNAHTAVSRNTGARRPRLRKKRLARRHYSGLNNIMSRGKRDLCNWTRERARSVGSAEETSLPLSLDLVTDFIPNRIPRYVTAYISFSIAVIWSSDEHFANLDSLFISQF